MATKKSTRRADKAQSSEHIASDQKPSFNEAATRLTMAKSIVQAVVAAQGSGQLEGQNFDIHWPLSAAIELLEKADLEIMAISDYIARNVARAEGGVK